MSLDLDSIGWPKKLIERLKSLFVGVFYDSQRDDYNSVTLASVAAILLTFVSGATTFFGLSESLPSVLALFAMIGIQSLLFVSSFRLGFEIKIGTISISSSIIYILCLFSSAFFSFTSFIDGSFSDDKRDSIDLQTSRIEYKRLISSTTSSLTKTLEKQRYALKEMLDLKTKDIRENSSDLVAKNSQIKEQLQSKSQRLHEKLMEEDKVGGATGILTKRGRGTVWEDLKRKSVLIDDELSDLNARMNGISTSLENFNSSIATFFANPIEPKRQELIGHCETLLKRMGSSSSLSCDYDPKISEIGSNYLILSNSINRLRNCDLRDTRSLSDLQATAEKCFNGIEAATNAGLGDTTKTLGGISIVKGRDTDLYEFSVALIVNGNIRAWLCMFWAILFDVLILLCGISNSRPRSFLDYKDPNDLKEETPRAIRLALQFAQMPINSDVPEYLIRAKNIVNESKPAPDLIPLGITSELTQESVKKLNLSEAGVLQGIGALKIITKGKKIRYGIPITTYLWLAEMVDKECQKDFSSSTISTNYRTVVREALKHISELSDPVNVAAETAK